MTHYYSLVVIPGEGDVEKLVEQAMAPHREDDDGNGLWDWYQIGGRWTGRLSGYDPVEDKGNYETCFLCHGTGSRDDALGRDFRSRNPDYTCNGCDGKGQALKHAGQWSLHDGDVVLVPNPAEFTGGLDDDKVPFAVLAHGSEGKPVLKREWNGEDFVERHGVVGIRTMLGTILVARERAGLTSRVAVVDYHC